ncbi:hypothetical protein [Photobacterium alginatilyticum]|uniref:Uncharacterized protein n=1 Tax=Photobacterium alginatilyticum TaxID=1775171 RepID=A0ABW9YL86_9GAMM|nr:hypothetical protein [Photobacterium alginatilyticum]NBI54563.1 hypothetical protein [Photobacterium alginatilyticum]
MGLNFINFRPWKDYNYDSTLGIVYDAKTAKVTSVYGNIDYDELEISISESKIFNVPFCIFLRNFPLYPSKYESSDGTVIYHAEKPPLDVLKVSSEARSFLDGGFALGPTYKKNSHKISFKDIEKYNIPGSRKRTKSQNDVMGISANAHINTLIECSDLIVTGPHENKWNWCHLIAFSMLSEKKAQTSGNLVVGSVQCNGQMLNMENAVKQFIVDTRTTITITVTATLVVGSDVAETIKYNIYEPISKMNFTKYFDAFTGITSDFRECKAIYDEIMHKYQSMQP